MIVSRMPYPHGIPPFVKTPLTDFAAILGLPDIQLHGSPQCKKFELKYYDCLESYGVEKGYDKCSAYYEDLLECRYTEKQRARLTRMKEELNKQIKEGKRTYSTPPEIDAFYDIRF